MWIWWWFMVFLRFSLKNDSFTINAISWSRKWLNNKSIANKIIYFFSFKMLWAFLFITSIYHSKYETKHWESLKISWILCTHKTSSMSLTHRYCDELVKTPFTEESRFSSKCLEPQNERFKSTEIFQSMNRKMVSKSFSTKLINNYWKKIQLPISCLQSIP